MKNWKVFTVYAEDYKDIYRMVIPAPSRIEAERYAESGGLKIIKVEEKSDLKINTNYLSSFLRREGFDEDGIDVICRTLIMVGLDMR